MLVEAAPTGILLITVFVAVSIMSTDEVPRLTTYISSLCREGVSIRNRAIHTHN